MLFVIASRFMSVSLAHLTNMICMWMSLHSIQLRSHTVLNGTIYAAMKSGKKVPLKDKGKSSEVAQNHVGHAVIVYITMGREH
jgi:hypothetical protein